jgi:hypothetical protein
MPYRTIIKDWFADLPLSHALAGNGVVLAVTSFSVEHWLKCVLLLASITLTGVTIWFKVKKNGGDK